MPEMGEYLIGAYLKVIEGCEFVDYNVHFPGGGSEGLKELDVIGFNFSNRAVFLCEATTHIEGLLYRSSYEYTIKHIIEKYERQKQYAETWLKDFPGRKYMLWSPVVSRGFLTENLARIDGLEVIINEEYARRINKLREYARKASHNVENPAFRLLQILEHMRG
jgi:hypothetical protein